MACTAYTSPRVSLHSMQPACTCCQEPKVFFCGLYWPNAPFSGWELRSHTGMTRHLPICHRGLARKTFRISRICNFGMFDEMQHFKVVKSWIVWLHWLHGGNMTGTPTVQPGEEEQNQCDPWSCFFFVQEVLQYAQYTYMHLYDAIRNYLLVILRKVSYVVGDVVMSGFGRISCSSVAVCRATPFLTR